MKIFYDSDIFYEITSEIEKGTMIHIQVPVIREPMTERR
jgi:hypothetical protein